MKKIICILLIAFILLSFASCTAADTVNQNMNQAADNFEVVRKITVYNARTDLVVLEMEGYMSLSNNSHSELVVTCKTGANEYKKNYVYLNEYVIYVVEDITSTVTDPYHYKIKFYTPMPDVDINH
ncbi:MAG: hypothetical protein J6S14_10965 [Clostridia bacterium]|nr:hypothetical protein [Clostridia bacterium]